MAVPFAERTLNGGGEPEAIKQPIRDAKRHHFAVVLQPIEMYVHDNTPPKKKVITKKGHKRLLLLQGKNNLKHQVVCLCFSNQIIAETVVFSLMNV